MDKCLTPPSSIYSRVVIVDANEVPDSQRRSCIKMIKSSDPKSDSYETPETAGRADDLDAPILMRKDR